MTLASRMRSLPVKTLMLASLAALLVGVALTIAGGWTGNAIFFLGPGLCFCFLSTAIAFLYIAPKCHSDRAIRRTELASLCAIPLGAICFRLGFELFGLSMETNVKRYEPTVEQLDRELDTPARTSRESGPDWRAAHAVRSSSGELSVWFLTGPRRGVAYFSGKDLRTSALPEVGMRRIRSKPGWYFF